MKIDYYNLITGNYKSPKPLDYVPDFAYSPLNILGGIYYPVIDEFWLKKGGNKPIWPGNKPYAVCITHDVDYVSFYNIKQNLRKIFKAIKTIDKNRRKKNISMSIESLVNIWYGFLKTYDPYSNLDLICDIEKENRIRSTLFFAPARVKKSHYSDCVYRFDDKIIFGGRKVMIRDVIKFFRKEGFEIGLHSQWHALDAIENFIDEKCQLEDSLGEKILSHRAHFLRYDNEISPEIYEKSGILYDSTLGFNDNLGFKRGTSYPFNLYKVNTNKKLSVMEIPLIIQDSAMFVKTKGLRINRETALEYIYEIKERIKLTGGVLTILWHPHTMNDEEYYLTFVDVIKMLKEDNPWFGTMSEIGEWWKMEIKIDLVQFLEDYYKNGV